jgi:hypothetical protein
MDIFANKSINQFSMFYTPIIMPSLGWDWVGELLFVTHTLLSLVKLRFHKTFQLPRPFGIEIHFFVFLQIRQPGSSRFLVGKKNNNSSNKTNLITIIVLFFYPKLELRLNHILGLKPGCLKIC